MTDRTWRGTALAACLLVAACGGSEEGASGAGESTPAIASAAADSPTKAVELWRDGQPAFGIFVPDERPREGRVPGERQPAIYTADGGEALAANPLLDYLFLNLEQGYDPAAVAAMREGLDRAPGSSPTLLVRIPPISADGEDAARERIREVFANGADGVVIPHVRSPEEATLAVTFLEEAGVDVWSPTNPTGDKVAMLMIEDPGALAAVEEIANLEGYSLLACGIGSLTRAMGDREAAEAGNLEVLAHATRVGRPDMITANAEDVERRIEEGFLGLLMGGPGADEAIRIGRAAAGR